jgi:hypothetical protein
MAMIRSGKALLGIGVLLAALAANIKVVVDLVRGREGNLDPTIDVTTSLAGQATDATQLLISLATGILGLLGFLFSEKVSTYWKDSTPAQRDWIIVGAAATCVSIATGLLTIWAIMSLSADGAVRDGLQHIVMMQVLELIELGFGLGVIALVALAAARRA